MNSIPQDLADALESAGLTAFFADCTIPHQREYLKWVIEAKRPEARKNRIEKAMHMLSEKRAEETRRGSRKGQKAQP
jgi:uncharacterized protein YdeI (YjbR/CyaY-like superfamily)